MKMEKNFDLSNIVNLTLSDGRKNYLVKISYLLKIEKYDSYEMIIRRM